MKCKACGKEIDEHVAGRELDACVAEAVMGWTKHGSDLFTDEVTGQSYELDKSYTAFVECFNPSINLSDAYEMEERIAELGLEVKYADILFDIIYPTLDLKRLTSIGQFDWRLIHATPEERCKAALMTAR